MEIGCMVHRGAWVLVCKWTCVHVCVCVCMCMYVWVYNLFVCRCACLYLYARLDRFAFIDMYISVCIYVCTCVYATKHLLNNQLFTSPTPPSYYISYYFIVRYFCRKNILLFSVFSSNYEIKFQGIPLNFFNHEN